MMTYDRSVWVKALTVHSSETICKLAEEISKNWQIQYKSLPQNGLSLLTLQDGVFNEPYYLGEIPISYAHLSLINEQGKSYDGAAQVMTDSEDLAVALAVCDSVMAHQLPGWEKVAQYIELGMKKREEENRVRGAMLAKTKVNFSLVSQEKNDAEN
ncbi:MAG: phosphonate C-P lyase system protein PhnG [Crocosphaera sp.]|nr:phosphonate C-P lyase system protein PhnG [Crocosphaera sp.]